MPFSAPSPRGVRKFQMHAFSQVVSANVPPMRLCNCLFIVKSTLSSNTSKDLSFQILELRTESGKQKTQN